MSGLELTGILPALTTPFDAEGALDLAGLEHNLAKYRDFGFAGYAVLDATGEGVCLTRDERVAVVRTVRAAVGEEVTVLAGVCEESTRRAAEAVLDAATAGADAALVLTPHFFGNLVDQGALRRFYAGLADASPIPLIVDHLPAITSVTFEPDTLAELAGHPRIVGFRDGSGVQSNLGQLVRRVPEGFRVLLGRAGILLAGLDAGASGAVIAEAGLAPRACLEIHDHARAGNRSRATTLQTRLAPLAQLFASRHGLPGLKAALGLAGFAGGAPRPPLAPIARADRDRVDKAMRSSGFFVASTRNH